MSLFFLPLLPISVCANKIAGYVCVCFWSKKNERKSDDNEKAIAVFSSKEKEEFSRGYDVSVLD